MEIEDISMNFNVTSSQIHKIFTFFLPKVHFFSMPITGYPVHNVDGCAPPPPAPSATACPYRVTATWNAQFQVSNPNKKLSITYADVVSSVFHKDYFLTETTIVPFLQGTGDVRTLDASFSLADSFVEGKVVDAMNGERSRGEVKFNVGMVADVVFRYSGWRGRRRVLRVWCSSGRMTGGPKRCLVG
ncbi:hypothetical protein ES332_A09G118500v1 [Gossypium tomentosum]|uniref:Late embryogenesis abundant protein LEA-2 subgroup domain-containing protein n=1 Tax=Gossypium tomentosum TaxID=34277 RepID=A0A5D2P1H3_GOSTO|nr:hypothetical protein ES332_A09G118500v1 [Gossypium tomentosum]